MSDDIIARLYCSYADPPCEQCTFCAARAEIERLRAAGDALASAVWAEADHTRAPMLSASRVALDAWEAARHDR